MSADAVDHIRALALALPEATEVEQWGAPTFRVRNKIFAMIRLPGHDGAERTSVWFKAPPGSQEVLVGADPERFFAPPYLGGRGWVAMVLDGIGDEAPDFEEAGALITRSFRLIAPKRIAAKLGDGDP